MNKAETPRVKLNALPHHPQLTCREELVWGDQGGCLDELWREENYMYLRLDAKTNRE